MTTTKDIDIAIVHAWMDPEAHPFHTATLEGQAFARIVSRACQKSAEYLSHRECDSISSVRDLVIFWTTKSEVDEVRRLIDRADNAYVVLPDPNWESHITLTCKYTLITPFEALDGVKPQLVHDTLQRHSMSAPNMTRHVFLPFGEMLYHDAAYALRFHMSDYNSIKESVYSDYPKQKYVYAGSFKGDRRSAIARLIRAGNTDVFGNIKEVDVIDYADGAVNHTRGLRGHIPPETVWKAYHDHEKVVHIADRATVELNNHRIRMVEYALADRDIAVAPASPADMDLIDIEADRINDLLGDGSTQPRYTHLIQTWGAQLPDRCKELFA